MKTWYLRLTRPLVICPVVFIALALFLTTVQTTGVQVVELSTWDSRIVETPVETMISTSYAALILPVLTALFTGIGAGMIFELLLGRHRAQQ